MLKEVIPRQYYPQLQMDDNTLDCHPLPHVFKTITQVLANTVGILDESPCWWITAGCYHLWHEVITSVVGMAFSFHLCYGVKSSPTVLDVSFHLCLGIALSVEVLDVSFHLCLGVASSVEVLDVRFHLCLGSNPIKGSRFFLWARNFYLYCLVLVGARNRFELK